MNLFSEVSYSWVQVTEFNLHVNYRFIPQADTCIFSHACAKVQRALSSLSCVCMYVEP